MIEMFKLSFLIYLLDIFILIISFHIYRCVFDIKMITWQNSGFTPTI